MAFFNYGTPAGADPRTYYAPREVGGRLATWQANPGRLLDYQTGVPLSERFSMAPATAPRDMVYGDSYGGVQGAEQAQLNAINALVMQQRQMQQAAYDRAMQRAIDERRYNQQYNYQMERNAVADRQNQARDAYNMRRQDLMDQAALDRLAMNERNNLTRLEIADRNEAAKATKAADDLRSVGSSLATDLSRLIPQADALQAQVSADDKMAEEYRNALLEAGNYLQKTPGGFFIATPDAPMDKERWLPAVNNALKQAPMAARRAQELQSIIKNLDSAFADAGKYGFQIDPASGNVVHPEAGLKFRINAPGLAPTLATQPAQTNAPVLLPKVQRGPADIVYDPVTKTRK